MDDVRAVLDAAGSERAAVLGQGYGLPDRAVLRGYASRACDAPGALRANGQGRSQNRRLSMGPHRGGAPSLAGGAAEWGTDEFAESWVARLAPSAAEDKQFVEWAARMMRTAASPATARAFMRMQCLMDAREVLPLIHVPTLVLDRADARLPKGPVDMPPSRRPVTSPIGSRARRSWPCPAATTCPWIGDLDSIVAEVGKFVTGAAPVREPTVSSSPSSSRTSSTPRSVPPSSGTSAGASCWSGTTPSCGVRSRSTAGRGRSGR